MVFFICFQYVNTLIQFNNILASTFSEFIENDLNSSLPQFEAEQYEEAEEGKDEEKNDNSDDEVQEVTEVQEEKKEIHAEITDLEGITYHKIDPNEGMQVTRAKRKRMASDSEERPMKKQPTRSAASIYKKKD